MDTNSNIPAEKKVVSVNFPSLQETGFGWDGSFTREAWRKACLDNLLAGKDQFLAWQKSWEAQIDESLPSVSFAAMTLDGSQLEFLNKYSNKHKPYALDFGHHTFDHAFSCSAFVFQQTVLFNFSMFNGTADFSNAIFNKYADFGSVNFNENVIFLNSKFNNSVSYINTHFKTSSFINVIFSGHFVSFENSIFEFEVNFEGSQYPNNFMEFLSISYKNVDFYEKVNFKNLNFNVYTNFENVKFRSGVDFENTKFNHQINFENVIFGDNEKKNYPSKVNFIKTEFTLDAKFNGGIFNVPTYFMKAKFFGDAEFNDVCFNQDIRFFGTDFNGGAFFNNANFVGDAVKRLGQMKKMAENNGQPDQALNFNALELDAKIKLPQSNIAFNFITSLYKILSDYGRSFIIPLGWYFLLLWMSFLYAYGYTKPSDTNQITNIALCNTSKEQPQLLNLSRDRAAIEYALFRAGGLMDSTDTAKQINSVNCKLFGEPIEPPEMRAWGVFKGIASIALLFLAALGLRNKYRIK